MTESYEAKARKWLEKEYGPKCPDFDATCRFCKAWETGIALARFLDSEQAQEHEQEVVWGRDVDPKTGFMKEAKPHSLAKPTEKRKEWDNEVEEALRHGRRYDDVGKIMKDLEAPVKRIEPVEELESSKDSIEGHIDRIWRKLNAVIRKQAEVIREVNALNDKQSNTHE